MIHASWAAYITVSLSSKTVQCPVLEDIENGKTKIYSNIPGAIDPGTTAVYLCAKGTWNTQYHNYARLCQEDGTWSGEPAFCGSKYWCETLELGLFMICLSS